MIRLLMSALTLCLLPLALLAQSPPPAEGPALLIADEVLVAPGGQLIASGNVEALQDDTRLQATRITYDPQSDQLEIEGPIRIIQPDGTVLLADAAQIEQGFRNGLLQGARMVLDEQLQIASVSARRLNGRYTSLNQAAVTSCQVCDTRAPLWQIRASRVIHDQQEKQLYFDDAQFRVLDVPVFYLPRLRLPDPTLKRAPGFLIPTLHSSTLLGFGIKTPYFIPIGDHQDVTLTPYLSPVTRTLELRYRRAFVNGRVTLNGAVSSDTIRKDELRSYLFATGNFGLGKGYKLQFDLKTVSDERYLRDYDITRQGRLESSIAVTRARRDTLERYEFLHYQTVRSNEDDSTQPTLIANAQFEKRLRPNWLPSGEIGLKAEAHGHYRYSNLDIDGPDEDSIVDGRDVARFNAELSWEDRWTLPMGLRAGASTHLWLDHFVTYQDASAPSHVSRATPGASLELRYPMVRQGANGTRSLIEPIVQWGWVGKTRAANPNDESIRVEFDEGNLLSLSRFPAADRREHGQTLAAGLRFLHIAPNSWSLGVTVGRVWRDEEDGDFTRSSGLLGDSSDWLIAARFKNALGLSLSARGLADGIEGFSKAEARAGWSNARMNLGASYALLVRDPDEDRPDPLSEWSFDGRYQINRQWTASTQWRYDLAGDRLDRVGLGLQYRNECVQVDFSARRRYARSAVVEPTTDFDLTVALKGFSTGGSAKEYRHSCSN